MTDDCQRRESVEVRRIIIQEIGHDLSRFYAVQMQLSPRLQALLHRLDEQQQQDR